MSYLAADIRYMKEALRLARRGMGHTNPNPMVGAVLVKNDRIIGHGYHRQAGFPHAEIEAIRSLRENPEGATLYVTLEPCCHSGRTSPCTDAIIGAGIKRVVYAVDDPNPRVCGKGAAAIHKANIDITSGILEKEARRLNEAFFTFHREKRPYIAIKFACSLDGKIATKTGDSKWITDEKARLFARKLRSKYQAILVGINTVLSDNPHLGIRIKGKKDPTRIIIDSRFRIPLNAQVLRDSNIMIATTAHDREKAKILRDQGVTLIRFDSSVIPIAALLEELGKRQIISILIEGGGETIGRFADAKLVDKVYAFHAPILIGGQSAPNAIGAEGSKTLKESAYLHGITHRQFNETLLTAGYVHYRKNHDSPNV